MIVLVYRFHDGPFPEFGGLVGQGALVLRQAGNDQRQPACRCNADRSVRPIVVFVEPCGGIAQSGFALEQGRDLGEIEADRGIGRGATENSVMLGARGITSTSAGRMSKDQWVTRSSALSSIPTTSLSSVDMRWVRTPTENDPDAERKISDADVAQASPETFRGRVASPSTWEP